MSPNDLYVFSDACQITGVSVAAVKLLARWKMIKLFLAHLWEAWCASIDIKARVPYVVEKLGHQLIPRPLPQGKKLI